MIRPFGGGELESDDGVLRRGELGQRTGPFQRLSACLRDHREAQRTNDPVEVLVADELAVIAESTEAE